MACCNEHNETHVKRKIIKLVLIINAIAFIAQFSAAIIAGSSALLADSYDMIGDVIAYGISLYAIDRGERWFAKAALIKGIIIFLLGCSVFVDVIFKISTSETIPSSALMLVFSVLGLCANALCLYLLTRHRNDDINMRSVWICARNDIVGNISVMISAALVYFWQSRWPDIVIGIGLALLFFKSAYGIIISARQQLRQHTE